MSLTTLSLAGFRNLLDAELEFPDGGVAIIGRNAQGKSNLLEAVHYLETFRSFRGARDEHLVRFGADHFRLAAELDPPSGSGDRRSISAAFQPSGTEKRVRVDGEEVARLADAIGRVGVVLFTPDDVRMISDGPHERRRFLDVVLSLDSPTYLRALQRFRHALAQRNAVLRERGRQDLVSAWNPVLVETGAAVSWARAQWLDTFADAFAERYLEVSGGTTARIEYDASIPGLGRGDRRDAAGEDGQDAARPQTVDAVEESYRRALSDQREREGRRRTTVVGPHRDELRFLAHESDGERDLREFGSGGQQRTAALAFRMLELETVRRRRGREPVLLLDDVFAELDESRSGRVIDLLERTVRGQVIVTAPKESDVRFRGTDLERWRMDGGRIER